MPYIYCADLWCDSCGAWIREDLEREGRAPEDPCDDCSYDSDDYPKWAPEEESDSPTHCAAGGDCLESVDLRGYGLPDDARMYGAETPQVGAIVDGGLTPHGAEYLQEMLREGSPTPYQEALHRLWREVYCEYLQDEDENED